MMVVRPRIASLIVTAAVAISVLAVNTARAESVSRSIRLTITVVGSLSLDIDEASLPADSGKISAEAFSEIKNHNIAVTKLARNNSNAWLFTKTE